MSASSVPGKGRTLQRSYFCALGRERSHHDQPAATAELSLRAGNVSARITFRRTLRQRRVFEKVEKAEEDQRPSCCREVWGSPSEAARVAAPILKEWAV
uniref:Uncharacterized protein n=1 Tax=Knipowitschia caucasica TaxID=637954 RepID=A0AAV2JJQ0_KNICA